MTAVMRRIVVLIAGVLVLSSAHVQVQSGDDARRPAGKQWPAVSGDWGNTRHSTLSQITTQNVTKLGGAWTSQKFDTPAGARTMPLVHDGLIFLTAPPSVYALDAKTGARVWRFQAGLQSGMGAPAREGVAVGDGLQRRHGAMRPAHDGDAVGVDEGLPRQPRAGRVRIARPLVRGDVEIAGAHLGASARPQAVDVEERIGPVAERSRDPI